MVEHEREMGQILTRLTEIERRLTISETDRRDDHRAIVRISEAMVTLAAKFPHSGPSAAQQQGQPPMKQVVGIAGAVGMAASAATAKLLAYFGL